MADQKLTNTEEEQEWISSLEWIIENESKAHASQLLKLLNQKAESYGINLNGTAQSGQYVNTISADEEVAYPGDIDLEQRIDRAIRWNAMMMVAKANHTHSGLGGHISTFSSEADLFQVALHHFLRGYEGDHPDIVYWQGHAAPGLYAYSYVAHDMTEKQLTHFRQEIQYKDGLPSYPHPRSMPEYWRFPTVSMGLGPIQAIYQARFLKYLQHRELTSYKETKVWAYLGDGEMDEPESTGALAIASREKLDNLIFIVNCNLQRLDGPVRGNNHIISEMANIFSGAGWKVIKVVWNSEWDKIWAKDTSGALKKVLAETPDGELQKWSIASGSQLREELFGQSESLQQLAAEYSDDQLERLGKGGHDLVKIYNAYKKAVEYKDGPVVILAHTTKGHGQGEAGEASNVTHNKKEIFTRRNKRL
ncbi:hypothetical protein LVD15_20935 [Fulvivirga maritima]|uniref:hypothetical protein n=1 Tax=Fulvivirga maritima TaxID=2904247 RepID=UPI001F42A625|nr:hypothetical protein [Fulvivirga maritima]UII25749.1 hypothetical protein LVD15_20935 [Fulvivirga maritima]